MEPFEIIDENAKNRARTTAFPPLGWEAGTHPTLQPDLNVDGN
jgi:hypothetical protein